MRHFFQILTHPRSSGVSAGGAASREAVPTPQQDVSREAGLTDNEFSRMTFPIPVWAHGVPQVTGMADFMQDPRRGLAPKSRNRDRGSTGPPMRHRGDSCRSSPRT